MFSDRYNGICDKDGCDFHHWRMGDENYFGPGPDFKVLYLIYIKLTDLFTNNNFRWTPLSQ